MVWWNTKKLADAISTCGVEVLQNVEVITPHQTQNLCSVIKREDNSPRR